jgi:FKBP-type peptidyl-prolyl cis-trans isomerases 1
MKTGEKGVCIFYSELGYKGTGKGNIPAFSPLRFEIEMIGKNKK